MSAVTNELALFHPGAKENAIAGKSWINFRPISQINKGSTIQFQINGTSGEYILLNKTRLHLKLRILRPDGTPVDSSDNVALVNLALHSVFRQCDVSLNQTIISSNVGIIHPLKS